MSDDANAKKSLREQVEDYKRRQKQTEVEAANSRADPDHEDIDLENGRDDQDDEAGRADFEKPHASGVAGGTSVVAMVSAVFLFVGVLLLLVSGVTYGYIRQSVGAEVTAPGVVLRNVVRSQTTRATNSSRETTNDFYYPVVEFALPDGSKKTVEMSEGGWPKAYDDGEKVTVRYDPEHPLHARLGGGSAMDFFVSLLTGFMGAVFTAIAIGVRRAFARH